MKKILLTLLCLSVIGCAKHPEPEKTVDVLLIGGGIMSASLGTYLNELEPDWSIDIYERLDQVALESSNAWNNAGTGHSAFCELNYTSEAADGSIDISKAVAINESFEISKQFWAYQVDQKVLNNPPSFINNVPHMSFVWGDDNVNFLKKRHEALQHSSLFRGMEYSEDPEQIKQWVPLIMEGREAGQKLAATRMSIGTDVNFGEITRQLVDSLTSKEHVNLHLEHEVRDIVRNDDGTWTVVVADLGNDAKETSVKAKFVFIGAGGGALKLLQKSGIEEAEGYAGFPVGGQFLVTKNQEIVAQHQAKLYGKASVGSPPMSVPHLDTRVIDGQKVLLFGPFATFSTKFLKNGSLLDMFSAMTTDNLLPMTHAGLDNIPLSTYLIGQLMQSQDDRMATLREYFPNARDEDWELLTAGQRVQIIKKDEEHGGILQFGTEVVSSADGSIAALLGASPGASTAAPIMLHLLEKTFKDKVQTPEWQAKLKEIIPSYGQKLNNNLELTNSTRAWSSERLQLTFVPVEPEAAATTEAPAETATAL
ncbi:malate:quinone oxidoreductase [Pseudomonas sp.]|uniref:malate:quinone oxidoreductase n=1 Tax=Pseudomonas sp. TaxID=306 RepID=UPI003D13BD25